MPAIASVANICVAVDDNGNVYHLDPQTRLRKKIGSVATNSTSSPYAVHCHHHPDVGEVYVIIDAVGNAWTGAARGGKGPDPL